MRRMLRSHQNSKFHSDHIQTLPVIYTLFSPLRSKLATQDKSSMRSSKRGNTSCAFPSKPAAAAWMWVRKAKMRDLSGDLPQLQQAK